MSADPTLGQPFVQITLNQLYSEVTGMRGDVRDLANSVKTAVTQLGDHEQRIRDLEHLTAPLSTIAETEKKRDDDRDRRLSALERRTYMTAGSITAAGAAASIVISLLSRH